MPRAPGQHALRQGRAEARSNLQGTGSRRCNYCMRCALILRQTCRRGTAGMPPSRLSGRKCQHYTIGAQCYPSTRRTRAKMACTGPRALDWNSSSICPPCRAARSERQDGQYHRCPDNNCPCHKGGGSRSQLGKSARRDTDRGTERSIDTRRSRRRGQGRKRWDNLHFGILSPHPQCPDRPTDRVGLVAGTRLGWHGPHRSCFQSRMPSSP